MLPYIEHRRCARYISQSLKKRYSGTHYENILLRAFDASTKKYFKVAMKELEVLNPSGHKYLMDKDPKT